MLTKQVEQAVRAYAEAAKWVHRCRLEYEAAIDESTAGPTPREIEAYNVYSSAEDAKEDALRVLTKLLVEEP